MIIQFQEDIDILTVFYSAFLQNPPSLVSPILERLTDCGQEVVKGILDDLRKRHFSSKTNETTRGRRHFITQSLFPNRNIFLCIANCQRRNLEILNEFVKMMPNECPLVHVQLPQMKRLVRRLCATFMKPEKMAYITKASVEDKSNHQSTKKNLECLSPSSISSLTPDEATRTAKMIVDGSMACAVYLIEKLPFDNIALRSFTGNLLLILLYSIVQLENL